jgi:hypothetical protein
LWAARKSFVALHGYGASFNNCFAKQRSMTAPLFRTETEQRDRLGPGKVRKPAQFQATNLSIQLKAVSSLKLVPIQGPLFVLGD